MLVDPQFDPTFIYVRCGKISKSFDTITKLNKPYYPQKRGTKGTEEKSQILCHDSSKDLFIESAKIIGMMHLPRTKEEYGRGHKVDVNAEQAKWQNNTPEYKESLKIDIESIDVAARKVPATKVIPNKTFDIYHLN